MSKKRSFPIWTQTHTKWLTNRRTVCVHVCFLLWFAIGVFSIFVLTFTYRDRDHHLKTFKSVIPASKLVEWLVTQVMCHTQTLFTHVLLFTCELYSAFYSARVAVWTLWIYAPIKYFWLCLIFSFCRVTARAARMLWPSGSDSAMLVLCTTVCVDVNMQLVRQTDALSQTETSDKK